MAAPSGTNALLSLLSADSNSNPKRRMETAVLDEDADAMRQLVTSGGLDVNSELTSQSAMTAMHIAARSDRPNSIRALVQLGANPLVSNFLGQTPLDCAMSAKAPRALLELARWAPIEWRRVRNAFDASQRSMERPMDSYASFTMNLLVGLMQPVSLADPSIASDCLASYVALVAATTEWREERIDPPMRPTRALFPEENERAPIIKRYVADSPFLLDSLMCPEAFLSALLGVYSLSGVQAALISLRASQSQLANALTAVDYLRDTRASVQESETSEFKRPQSLSFACRNIVRKSVALSVNYVNAVHGLPLDFATKAFLVYNREVACVMSSRPRTRYTGL